MLTMTKFWASAGGETPQNPDMKHGFVHVQIGDDECVLECDLTDPRTIRETVDEALIRYLIRATNKIHSQVEVYLNSNYNE